MLGVCPVWWVVFGKENGLDYNYEFLKVQGDADVIVEFMTGHFHMLATGLHSVSTDIASSHFSKCPFCFGREAKKGTLAIGWQRRRAEIIRNHFGSSL